MKTLHLFRVLFAVAWLVLGFNALAVPASPTPFKVRQPDGTEITLRVRGDEWFHWYETVEGRPAVLDSGSGFWMFSAPSDTEGVASSGQRVGLDLPPASPWQPKPSVMRLNTLAVKESSSRRPMAARTSGTGFVPVLLGNFSDTTPRVSALTLSNILFATGPGVRSMSTYFSEVSYGKFTVSAGPSGVQNWVNVPNTAAFYGATNTSAANSVDTNAALFVRAVVLGAIASGYNFAPYDQDGDGKVDVVNIIHTGMGEESGGGPNAIWSHRFSLKDALGPNGPVVGPGGIVIDDYVIQPELAGDTNATTIGVFVHEHGHALGLPDLYDGDYSSLGVGKWSGMSYGSNNGLVRGGDCPAHFDPWCKAKLGWLSPINYTLNYQNVQFPSATSNAFAARLWKDGLAGPQYYLVENRQKNGFDAALPAAGLLIWHIDESKVRVSNTQEWYPIGLGGPPARTNSGNYLVSLIQADNLWQMEVTNRNSSFTNTLGDSGDPFPGSSNNRVFGPNTAPSSYSYNVGSTPGYNSFVTVSNISNPGPVMTADLYTRSPNSGPLVEWVNIAGYVPPYSGAQFSKLDAQHPVAIRAFPGQSGRQLSLTTLFITRGTDGRWWNFTSKLWETNVTGLDVPVTGVQQNGFTLGIQDDLPGGTNLVNGSHTFIVRVIDAASVVTELQMAMTAVHAPVVRLSLADNAVVNTLTNFTAVATEDSGIGVQRVEVALYYETEASDAGSATRWYWDGYSWTTTPQWLGADFPGNPPQATLYYPIGPSQADLLTEREYTVSARAVDAFGDAATNTISVFYDTGSPATIYWRYSSSGNWDESANWNPSRVPQPSDHVVVNAPGDYTVWVNTGANVASLRFGRVVGLDRQNLVLPTGATLATGVVETNKLYGRATLDHGGNLASTKMRFSGGSVWNWTNGVAGGYHELRPGATLNIQSVALKTLGSGAVLDNRGTINWAGPGVIYNYGLNGFDRATISNQVDAVFNLTTDGQVFHHDYNESFFYNAAGAQFIKSGGANSNVLNRFMFFSSGEVRVDTGDLRFEGTAQFNTGTLLSGNGVVRLLGSSAINGPVPGTANLRLEGGTLTASGAAAYTGSAGMDWTGGTLAGPFAIFPGSTLRISGAATKTLGSGAVLNNSGSVTWAGPGTIYNYGLNGFDRATINNSTNANFSILTDGQVFSHDYNPSWFNNKDGAVFRKLVGSGTNLINNFIFNNVGEMTASVGTLEFNEALNLGGGVMNGAGQFLISGGTTTLSNLTTISGTTVKMIAGTLFGDAPSGAGLATTAGGTFDWAGGTQAGTVGITAGTTFGISGTALKSMGSGAVINNAGSVTWSGTGNIYNYGLNGFDRATINNLPGASFSVTGNAAFTHDYNPSFINIASNATFSKVAGGGVTTCNWWFNNNGAVGAQNGTLALANGGNSSGSFAVGADAFLRFTGGTHSLSNGVSFAGAGRMQVDGATVLLNGALTLGSPAQVMAWDLTSGTLGGNGTWLGKFAGIWTGGTIGGNQTITADGALVVTNSGAKTLGSGAVLNNQGSITWFGPGPIYNYGLNVFDRATINNGTKAFFKVSADGQVFARDYGPSTFNNLAGARFVKTAGANASTINEFIFNSPGEIRAETGSLLFNYIVTLGPAGKLTGPSPIRLAGDTTVIGTLNSGANLRLESGGLTGASAATYTGGGVFDWTGGTIGGVLTLAPGNTLNSSGATRKDLGSGAVLNNQGTITWTGPGTIYNYGLNGFDRATINNQDGGRFNIADDGQVFSHDYNQSTFNNLAGARFSKTGGTNSSSINHFVFNSPGEVRVDSGNLVFDSVATFGPGGNLNGSGLVRWAGDVRISGSVASTAAIRLENGTLTGQSGATYGGTGALNWTGGTMAGTLAFASGSVVDINGVATKTFGSGAVVNNQGTVNWSGPGVVYNYGLNQGDRATFNNLSGGTLNIASDGPVFAYDYNPSFLNNLAGAKIRKTAGTGISSVNYTIANAGTVETLAGTFHASGTFASSAPSAEISLIIGGIQPGTGFTRLNASGNLPLAGTLTATLAGGFEPATGATFAILNYGSRAGQFSTLQLPPLSLGRVWKVDYGATVMTLSVEQGIAMSNAAKNGSGNFEFDLTGPPASGYVIQASTNLVNWIPIQTNSPFTGTFHFIDPSGTTLPARFYKVLIGP